MQFQGGYSDYANGGTAGRLPSQSQYVDYERFPQQQFYGNRQGPHSDGNIQSSRPLVAAERYHAAAAAAAVDDTTAQNRHSQQGVSGSGGREQIIGGWHTTHRDDARPDHTQQQQQQQQQSRHGGQQTNYVYDQQHTGISDDFAVLQQYAANFGASAAAQGGDGGGKRSTGVEQSSSRTLPKPAFLQMPREGRQQETQQTTGTSLSFNDLLQKALAATPKGGGAQQDFDALLDARRHHQHQQQHQQQPPAGDARQSTTHHRKNQPEKSAQKPEKAVAPKEVTFVAKAVETALRVDTEHEAAEVAEFEELERSILSQHPSPSPRQPQRKLQQQRQDDDEKDDYLRPSHSRPDSGGYDDRLDGRRSTTQRGGDRDKNASSTKYVKGLFQHGEEGPSAAELRRREEAVKEQEQQLQKKIEAVGREGAANRVEKRRLANLARSLEERERQLVYDRKEFEEWSEGQRADVAVWKENQEERIRKKLSAVERKAKLLAAAPSRAERAEIQKLEALVEELQQQEKRQADVTKQQLKRQQARIAELTEREVELQEEIAVLVEERLASPRGSASGGRSSHSTAKDHAAAPSHSDAEDTSRNTKKPHKKKKKAAAAKQPKKSLAAAAAEYEKSQRGGQQQQRWHQDHAGYDFDNDTAGAARDEHDDVPPTESVYIDGQARVAQAYERRQRQLQQHRGASVSSGNAKPPMQRSTPQPQRTQPQQQASYLAVKKVAAQRAAQQQNQQQVQSEVHDVDRGVNYAEDAAEFPETAGEFLHDDELLNEIVYEDRKIERQYASGRVEIVFRNGTQKQIFPDGNVIVKFTNGDMKRSTRDGLVVYFYAEAQTTHTTHPDGTEVFEFPNGQSERHLTDGSKSIRFNDGTLKKISKSGQAESIFPDGTRLVEHPNGVRDIYLPDGSHTREQA